jgi:hypothetical protein
MYARSHPLSIARSTPQTVSVADATVEDFAHPKVLKQELVYFAWARLFTSKPPKGYVWSNKGTLKTYATMPTSMITEAVQLRARPVIIERPDDPAAGPALIPQAAPHPVVIPRVLHAAGNVHLATQPLASTMLDDAKWCGDASAAVTSSALAGGEHPFGISGPRANNAVIAVAARLDAHMRDRVDGPKRKHACWNMVSDNISRIVAILELGGRLRRTVKATDSKQTLLSLPSMGTHLDAATNPDVHGSYLQFDVDDQMFVRSGKVVGRGIAERNKEHAAASRAGSAASKGSKFYQQYPSVRVGDGRAWEDLKVLVGIGWDSTNEAAIAALCDESEGGVLVWSKESLAMAGRLNMARDDTAPLTPKAKKLAAQVKKLNVIGYLFEIVLELCIGVDDNVSVSAGFEAFFAGR